MVSYKIDQPILETFYVFDKSYYYTTSLILSSKLFLIIFLSDLSKLNRSSIGEKSFYNTTNLTLSSRLLIMADC